MLHHACEELVDAKLLSQFLPGGVFLAADERAYGEQLGHHRDGVGSVVGIVLLP